MYSKSFKLFIDDLFIFNTTEYNIIFQCAMVLTIMGVPCQRLNSIQFISSNSNKTVIEYKLIDDRVRFCIIKNFIISN